MSEDDGNKGLGLPSAAALAALLLAAVLIARAIRALYHGAVSSQRSIRVLLRRAGADPAAAKLHRRGPGIARPDDRSGGTSMKIEAQEAGAKPFVITWLGLLLLAGLSIGSAFLGIGAAAPVVEFGIAAAMAAMIFIVFMRLKGPPSLKWIVAGTGFFWLLFLYGLSMTDYASRHGWPTH